MQGSDGDEGGGAQHKEELEARDELKTGNKARLWRRPHSAIVRVHLEACDTDV